MKILSRLTLKNLRLNKSRTIVTIIGIMLSAALIMVVAGMMTSFQQTMIEEQINYTGDFELLFYDTNADYIEKINANRDVEDVYVQAELGCAKLEKVQNEYRPYINVTALSKNSFEDGFNFVLEEGRLPENENEIVLTQDALYNIGKTLKVGDKVTFGLGKRVASNGTTLSDYDEYASVLYNEYNAEGEAIVSVTESLENIEKKEYTITGILKYCESIHIAAAEWTASSTAITVLEDYPDSDSLYAYANIKPESEKNFLKVTEEISGLSENTVANIWGKPVSDAETVMAEMESCDNFSAMGANQSLLEYKGYNISDSTLTFLYLVVFIIVLVIVLASVFVIRNSFAISITEKTKLYGMLLSVGATPKQIKKNVLFEGVVLGVIAVILGLSLGAGVIALLVWILNMLLGDYLYGLSFTYSLSLWVPFFVIGASALVIFLSTYSAAVRASKIAPITAIRQNKDVKISDKEKHYKSPKFVRRFFGMGGDIAYKNLKRSKKKYRTTVISIIVSVAIFITISSFIDYGMNYSTKYFSEMYYNMEIYAFTDEEGEVIRSLEGVDESLKVQTNYDTMISDFNGYTEDAKKHYLTQNQLDENDTTRYSSTFILEDESFKEFAEVHGFNYDEIKDKVLLFNSFTYKEGGKSYEKELLNVEVGDTLKYWYEVYNDDGIEESPEIKIEIGGEITHLDNKYKNDIYIYSGDIIVSESWYNKYMGDYTDNLEKTMHLSAEDTSEIQDAIRDLGYYQIEVYNYDDMVKQNNAIVLIMSIFAYGFIGVISLIGVTNIFNTITTNMNLRRKEFATLRSVGMTNKEFNKMIRLESVFYGIKSLIIGIPIGILGGFLVHFAFDSVNDYEYMFPWLAILISVIFVFAVIWLIMKFSISKIKKQNIIETIRNDNI